MNKWNKTFWVDLAERVGATFLGALLTLISLTETTPVDWSDGQIVWVTLGVPTLFSLIKGVLANLGYSESGASMVPSPPAQRVVDPPENLTSDSDLYGYRRDEGGYTVLGALGLGLIVLSVILLVLNLLGAFAVSPIALVVCFVIGLVLLLIGGGVRGGPLR